MPPVISVIEGLEVWGADVEYALVPEGLLKDVDLLSCF